MSRLAVVDRDLDSGDAMLIVDNRLLGLCACLDLPQPGDHIGLDFDKVAAVADAEVNDPDRQRERLLEAQMQLEAGEIDEAQFAEIESDVFARLREIKARTQPEETIIDDEHRVAGVEITVDDGKS